MKLLILTQYFPPEVGAPQNRLFELALRLQAKGFDCTVLTAMPNYPQMKIYEGYQGKKVLYEEISGLKVHRTSIYVPKSKSIFQRLLNYFSFVFSSWKYGRKKFEKFDFLLVESPPLFLGITAYVLSRKLKAKMIFNVSDLWPESAEKLGLVSNKLFLGLAYKLESFLYKKSWLVCGQTQGICSSISTRFPSKKVYWLPNGVDLSYYKPFTTPEQWQQVELWKRKNDLHPGDFVCLYAGILGHAQGLEVIINAAQELKEKKHIKFIFLGSGPEKENLKLLTETLKLKNVFFLDVVSKSEMPVVVAACSVSIIPLKRLDLFKGAIPSKIFENLAMEKPILLGVEGEAKELFIDEGRSGLAFTPEDHRDLAKNIVTLTENPQLCSELGKNARAYVSFRFNREIIADNFVKQLQNG